MTMLLSGCDPSQMWLHRKDGIIEKCQEEHFEVNETLADIHFLSRTDDQHMIMVTAPSLQEGAYHHMYGSEALFLVQSSYQKESWGERYGETHYIGPDRYVYDELLLTEIDLTSLTPARQWKLQKEIEQAGIEADGYTPDGIEHLIIYEDDHYGSLEPCISLAISDYTDMAHVVSKKLYIYTESGHYEIDRFLSQVDRYGPETDSRQQASWKEQLKEITRDIFWRNHRMKFGGYEIPMDHVLRERYIYIGPTNREGMVIIQVFASVIDVNNPRLLEMFPELAAYTFREDDLINIYIGGFPDNKEILSLITISEDS